MALEFGIAVGDITPPAGLPMGGYAARGGAAEGTLDPLCCRTAVVSDGAAVAALVALDLVYVSAEWAGPLRQRIAHRLGCSAAGVLIGATHTHAGPAVFRSGVFDCDALRAYERSLADAVLRTVDDSRASLQPAQLSVGHARQAGVGASRREMEDGVDDVVRVLVARTPTDRLLGVIATFGCHPTVLSPTNLRYSRDLFGAAVDTAAAQLGAPVVLFNAAAADVSTRFTRRAQNESEVARLGHMLGAGIVRGALAAVALPGTRIRARVDTLPVAARALPSADTAQRLVAEAAAQLQQAQARGAAAGETRRSASQLEGALAQLLMVTRGSQALLGHPPDMAMVQLLDIGGCDVLGVPGEVFSAVGHDICAARPHTTMLVGYANDYLGYFVPPALAATGGYEAWMALVEPTSAARLADRLTCITVE